MVWEKLGTTSVTFTAVNTSWKELGRGTLSSGADTINSGTFTAKDNIMILQYNINSGSVRTGLRLNADTGNNYAHRRSVNGATDATNVNHNRIVADTDVDGSDFTVSNFTNVSAQEKLGILNRVHQSGSGAGNAPDREEMVGKWTNTSSQITSVQSYNAETGDFDTGSEIVVLGYDNDEADTGSNFWQELASVTLGSSNAEISSGTITAKKYLWVQIDQKGVSNNVGNISVRFNNDTGTNYASRYSVNGGSDNSSQTSKTSIYMHDDAGDDTKGSLHNIFIINKADKEKLIISETIQNTATGAGTAPARSEEVGKWANTSNQITEIDIFGLNGGSFDTGSSIKVWGAN